LATNSLSPAWTSRPTPMIPRDHPPGARLAEQQQRTRHIATTRCQVHQRRSRRPSKHRRRHRPNLRLSH
jgi:hypothetical protein